MPTQDRDFQAGDRIVWRATVPDCWIDAYDEGVIKRVTNRGFVLKMDRGGPLMACLPYLFDKAVAKGKANDG